MTTLTKNLFVFNISFKKFVFLSFILFFFVFLFTPFHASKADTALLHEFAGGNDDGSGPFNSLTLSDTILYGMTNSGGDNTLGTIFQIGTDGTGFTLLHKFAGGNDDGSGPFSFLTLSGTTLYGMTNRGGNSNLGTIFQIGTDGTGFTLLHKFAGGNDDGSHPDISSLTLFGTTLYGMTYDGGNSNLGTIFQIGTDGTGFTLLHEFAGGNDDGSGPSNSLVLSGTTLYGMTYDGGNSNLGTIFQIGTDGTGFTLLHKFAGGNDDGSYPDVSSLTLSGTTLYGITNRGGDSNLGTIFQIGTDSTGFTLLHKFAGGNEDGSHPYGLILSGTTLYGMTNNGGDHDLGTIFLLEIPIVPTVTSPTSSSITSTTVTLGANVTSLGVPVSISERGTCLGTLPEPTTNCLAEGGNTTGVLTQTRTGLSSGKLYYYRGYAINDTGTGYSEDATFTTSPNRGSRVSGGSSVSRLPVVSPLSTAPLLPMIIPGCDDRVTGFSYVTGQSCVNNLPFVVPPTNNSCSLGFFTLRQGSRGVEVKCLQTILHLNPDGIFGPMTKAALIQFQLSNNLKGDGVIGAFTMAKLKAN